MVNGILHTAAKTFSDDLGRAIAPIILMIILAALILVAGTVIFGAIFFIAAYFFYKKKKRKSFLIFGILGSVVSSIGLSLIISSMFFHDMSAAVLIAPIFIILGIYTVAGFFKKLK